MWPTIISNNKNISVQCSFISHFGFIHGRYLNQFPFISKACATSNPSPWKKLLKYKNCTLLKTYLLSRYDTNDANMWAWERWALICDPKLTNMTNIKINNSNNFLWSPPSLYNHGFWIFDESQMRIWIIQKIGVNKIKMK